MTQDPRNALSALLRAADIEDHEQVLNAANAAIKADKTDNDAKHTKVVALLKLDRFDDALRLISSSGIKLEATCILEQAYALYKTGKLEEASNLLETSGLEKRSLRHVAAQVAYRSEKFHETEIIYRHLLDTDAANEESDLKINITAAAAQSQWQGIPSSSPGIAPEALDTFELCYNMACGELARGNTSLATTLLQRAAMLCDNSDELTEEEKKTELRSIRAQQAYLFARIGKPSSATEVYEILGPATANDGRDFAVITQNNHFALEPTGNPFMRQRKAETLMATAAQSSLFNYQSNILKRNNLIVDLGAFKTKGVTVRTQKILHQTKLPTLNPEINSVSVLNAAAHVQGLDNKEAIRKLQTLAAKRPNDVGLVLTIIQLQLQQKETTNALTTLTSFLSHLESSEDVNDTDVRFGPGLVALAVSLFRLQQREASAKAELVKAAQYWQGRPSQSVESLLLEAGVELMRSSNADDLLLAGSSFDKLFREQQGSEVASAGLVAAFAASEASKVRQHADKLPPVHDLIGGIDVDGLFAAGVAVAPSSAASKKRSASDEVAAEKPTKRRRRKLPKDYVEGKTPDPERWLSLRDRSSYRPKGRKGKKRAGEATQGGIVKEEETLGLVGGGGVKVEKAAAPPSNNKKKGKKGKK